MILCYLANSTLRQLSQICIEPCLLSAELVVEESPQEAAEEESHHVDGAQERDEGVLAADEVELGGDGLGEDGPVVHPLSALGQRAVLFHINLLLYIATFRILLYTLLTLLSLPISILRIRRYVFTYL